METEQAGIQKCRHAQEVKNVAIIDLAIEFTQQAVRKI